MDAESVDCWVSFKYRLGAIPMMHIPIDDENVFESLLLRIASNGRLWIEHAVAVSAIGKCVVATKRKGERSFERACLKGVNGRHHPP